MSEEMIKSVGASAVQRIAQDTTLMNAAWARAYVECERADLEQQRAMRDLALRSYQSPLSLARDLAVQRAPRLLAYGKKMKNDHATVAKL